MTVCRCRYHPAAILVTAAARCANEVRVDLDGAHLSDRGGITGLFTGRMAANGVGWRFPVTHPHGIMAGRSILFPCIATGVIGRAACGPSTDG